MCVNSRKSCETLVDLSEHKKNWEYELETLKDKWREQIVHPIAVKIVRIELNLTEDADILENGDWSDKLLDKVLEIEHNLGWE